MRIFESRIKKFHQKKKEDADEDDDDDDDIKDKNNNKVKMKKSSKATEKLPRECFNSLKIKIAKKLEVGAKKSINVQYMCKHLS